MLTWFLNTLCKHVTGKRSYKNLLYLPFILLFLSCSKEWEYKRSIRIPNIKPFGICYNKGSLWVSDKTHHKVVKIDLQGNILKTYNFKDPMHFFCSDSMVLVPEFSKNTIKLIRNDTISDIYLFELPNHITSVFASDSTIAIADYHNHRVLLQEKGKVTILGNSGFKQIEICFPTDVKLYEEKVYISEGENHRVQVFKKDGEVVDVIGDEDEIGHATGLHITSTRVYVADYSNDKILLYNHSGRLKHEISEYISGPTDVSSHENLLYIVNHKSEDISIFSKK